MFNALAPAIVLSSTLALAQGGANSSLAGVVVDAAGGVVPGATVTVRNNATGTAFESVSNSAGAFSIPALDPGTYTVTVALDGFKTAVISDVRLLAATPGSVRATLEVGNLAETVEVKGGTELVQTQSSTISSTITTEQITNLPLVSRNPYNFAFLQANVTGYENNEFGVPRINANGSQMHTNYQIDGNTNTQKDRAGLRMLPISEVVVREVKVITSGFAPEG